MIDSVKSFFKVNENSNRVFIAFEGFIYFICEFQDLHRSRVFLAEPIYW